MPEEQGNSSGVCVWGRRVARQLGRVWFSFTWQQSSRQTFDHQPCDSIVIVVVVGVAVIVTHGFICYCRCRFSDWRCRCRSSRLKLIIDERARAQALPPHTVRRAYVIVSVSHDQSTEFYRPDFTTPLCNPPWGRGSLLLIRKTLDS